LLPDKENMVDGAFLQTRIQVERLVQHVTCVSRCIVMQE